MQTVGVKIFPAKVAAATTPAPVLGTMLPACGRVYFIGKPRVRFFLFKFNSITEASKYFQGKYRASSSTMQAEKFVPGFV